MIRIEPDWNVKTVEENFKPATDYIRIEPDWNVKVRSEVLVGKTSLIRIEPDWNVKENIRADKNIAKVLE